jgi:hypothetical protein
MLRRKEIKTAFLIVSFVLAVSGCSTKFRVNHYPDFYNPSIKSVAVVPFLNDTSRKGAGIAVATHVSAALAANGTYKITDPAQLEKILKDKDMPKLPEDYNEVTKELAKLDMFQAFITGEIFSDSFINELVEYDDYYDDYPYWYYPYWYPPYWYYPDYYEFGGQAYVSTEVSMVSIPDETVLGAANVKASVDISDRPELKRYTIQMALNKLSDKIVRIFTIVPVEIKVNPDKAMKTAVEPAPGEFKYTSTFSRDEKSMYVVLCLPESASMNEFEIAISPRGKPENIISSINYTWERGKHCQSVEFSPREIAQKNGTGNYSVHFISRGRIVLTRHFKIK